MQYFERALEVTKLNRLLRRQPSSQNLEIDDTAAITSMVQKVLGDIQTGGFTIVSQDGAGYITTRHNGIVNLRSGLSTYHASLNSVTNTEIDPKPHTTRQAMSLDLRDGIDLPSLPSGSSRHGTVYKERYPRRAEDPEEFIGQETPAHPHFNISHKYDLSSPECPPEIKAANIAGQTIDLAPAEVIKFCEELIEAKVDEEATAEKYQTALESMRTNRSIYEVYWNKTRRGIALGF